MNGGNNTCVLFQLFCAKGGHPTQRPDLGRALHNQSHSLYKQTSAYLELTHIY
jgi:hypothetical protein